MSEKRNVGQATASLVLGILSLILFGILTAIPAVICGHVAKSKIKKNPEALCGDGLAIAGLVMGYIVIGFSILIIPMMAAIAIPSFHKARANSIEKACVNNCRVIDAAKEMYAMEAGLGEGTPVSETDIAPYLNRDLDELNCLQGGTITLNPVGTPPTCSYHQTDPLE